MEPQNATAWVHDGRCEVWAPTQAPGVVRFRVADAVGFDLDDVAIHTTLLGGGFGRRLFADFAVEAACLAQRLARPVKIIWSREDDQENDWYRPMATSRVRGAVTRVENGGRFKDRGRIGELSGAAVERSLAAADAAEIEPDRRAAEPVEHVEQVVDQRIVHRAAELRVRVQHDGDRRMLDACRMIPALDSAGRAGEDDFGHSLAQGAMMIHLGVGQLFVRHGTKLIDRVRDGRGSMSDVIQQPR
jgi:CO/xanthine dehydrogenase Mo-binding subunit